MSDDITRITESTFGGWERIEINKVDFRAALEKLAAIHAQERGMLEKEVKTAELHKLAADCADKTSAILRAQLVELEKEVEELRVKYQIFYRNLNDTQNE